MADDDEPIPTGPFCVVWIYRDAPDAFERAARFAKQNLGYGLIVVVVFTEHGARLVQTDRMRTMLKIKGLAELVEELGARDVSFELDQASARQHGIVETLGAHLPNLRVADEARLAELATGSRVSARY